MNSGFTTAKTSQASVIFAQWLASSLAFELIHWGSFTTAIFFFMLFSLSGLLELQTQPYFLSLALLSAAVFIPVRAFRLYARERELCLLPPTSLDTIGETANLGAYLTLGAARGLQVAERVTNGQLSAERLLIGLLEGPEMNGLLTKLGLTTQLLLERLRSATHGHDDDLTPVLLAAKRRAVLNRRQLIGIGDLLLGFAEADEFVKQLLFDLELEVTDLEALVEYAERLERQASRRRAWYERPAWKKTGGFARDTIFGYTTHLEAFAEDLTELFALESWLQVYGRESEITKLEEALVKERGANALLIGEAGSGRATIVLGLAERLMAGEVPEPLKGKHLLRLDVGRILAAGDRETIEARLVGLLDEAAASGNTILFIHEIENLLGGPALSDSRTIGTIDATQILLPYLERSDFQVTGTTSRAAFHQRIELNTALTETFVTIEVPEANEADVIRILLDESGRLEVKHNLLVTFPAIRAAVKLAARYIHDQPNPQKSLTVLENTAVRVAGRSGKVVGKVDVEAMVSELTKVPVEEATGGEAERLLQLEDFLHQRVIDQVEAIRLVSDAMRRARSGVREGGRPVGSFLFLGPTGVGKTETAKSLAEAYFRDETAMVRLDMSEYQNPESLDRLIGPSSDPSVAGGVLTRAMREHPFTLLLLDEIEKASPDILNLFLQVLDEGKLTDNTGRSVDFTNAIIIATSNAGAELIRKHIQGGGDPAQLRPLLLDYLQSKGIFKPEFLNRFDAVVAFEPLGAPEVVQIVELMLNKLDKRLREQDIKIAVSGEAVRKIAQIGFDPVYGARPLRRMIQEKIENLIAKKLLSGEIERGATLVIGPEDIQLPKKLKKLVTA